MTRWLVALAVFGLACLGTFYAWYSLTEAETKKIALVIDAEAESDRQELIRNVERVVDALDRTRRFWDEHGGLPRDQWQDDADIELSHFGGLDAILWFENDGETRYLRSPDFPFFDHRPDEEELASYQAHIDALQGLNERTTRGPTEKDGEIEFALYIPSTDQDAEGGLIAIIDLRELVGRVYSDVSPSYAITVHDDATGLELFRSGDVHEDVDDRWIVEDEVTVFEGSVWRLHHSPTQETSDIVRGSSAVMILGLGLMVAILLGTLTYEYAGALGRARSAESDSASLAVANKDLERIVAARTLEVRRQARDLQTLTDSVAHDMRNPMNAVAMTLQLLDRRLDKAGLDDERALIERIEPSLQQMEEILERLVGLSTVTHRTFEREEVDLKTRAETIFESLVAAEPPPPVTLKIRDIPTANADAVLVDVLLTNLLSNAVKYTRSKDERNIVFEAQDDAEPTIYCIQDSGVGFDRESGEKIFEAFERLDTDDDAEGIGLGLTIVLRVIQRHGGRIWAEGEPGEGASFFFTLEPRDH